MANGVQQLPSGFEPLIEGFAQLADAAGKAIFEEEYRMREIRNNPELMIQLAQMSRAATREDTLPQLAEAMRVEEGFLTGLADAFVPSSEERFETAFLEGDGPEILADTQILQGLLGGQTAEAAMEMALPFREAFARAQGLETQVIKDVYEGEVFSLRMNEGVAEMTVDVEKAKLRLEKQNVFLQEETIEMYRDIIEDPNTPEHIRNMAAIGLVNPTLAGHIQFHENVDFQMSLRKLTAAEGQSPGDQFATFVKLQDAREKAVERLQEAIEAGDARAIEVATQDINNLNAFQELLTNSGFLPAEVGGIPITGVTARVKTNIFGTPKAAELLNSIPMSNRVRRVFQNLAAAEEAGETITEADIAVARSRFEGADLELRQFDRSLSMLDALGATRLEGEGGGSPAKNLGDQLKGMGSTLVEFGTLGLVKPDEVVQSIKASWGFLSPQAQADLEREGFDFAKTRRGGRRGPTPGGGG